MAKDSSNIFVISIVAVVAVVGMVTLFMGGGDGSTSVDEEGNIAGEAFAFSKYRSSSYPSRYTPRVRRADLSSCRDWDDWVGTYNERFYPSNTTGTNSYGRALVPRQDACSRGRYLIERGCRGTAMRDIVIDCGTRGCQDYGPGRPDACRR